MRLALLDLVRCPACVTGVLALAEGEERWLRYGEQDSAEVETGSVICRNCGIHFPVRDYVLSFEQVLEPGIRQDAAFWGAFYRQHYERGLQGFADTELAQVPFLAQSVPEAIPVESRAWFHILHGLVQHPWLRPGGLVVDMGTGSGWSALFLARRGFQVIAYDPAFDAVAVAKRHAIKVGVAIEYLCCDAASFHMPAESVDAVFALHALHHVPDVDGALRQVHALLRVGGVLAVDEHCQDEARSTALHTALLQEAEAQIFPPYRREGEAPVLPSHHSQNEGVGSDGMLETIERYFHADVVRYRHITMDILGPLAYLLFDRSHEALHHGQELGRFINQALLRAWPDAAEYMTVIAQKRGTLPQGPVFAPPPRSHAALLAAQLEGYKQELGRLHALVAEKNAHIKRLELLIERISNGRVMRILRWLLPEKRDTR